MAFDCNFIAVRWQMLGSNDGLFVNMVKKLWVPWKVENFLSSISLISSSRRILFHGQANCLIFWSYNWQIKRSMEGSSHSSSIWNATHSKMSGLGTLMWDTHV